MSNSTCLEVEALLTGTLRSIRESALNGDAQALDDLVNVERMYDCSSMRFYEAREPIIKQDAHVTQGCTSRRAHS